ncbi:MAG TPA: hypothetical protein VM686_05200 [Polyangiaceae bacterium]|nr:hypothetical protein [Polyangiaceae bacterium]
MKKLRKSPWAWSAIVLALLLPVGQASAQDRDPGAAQALFDQARQLVKEGKFAEACPKLVESNRLDPGIGTQFHLADCYEQGGKIASAWGTFLDVASQARAAGQTDREKAAQKRAEKLEPRLPRLTLNVPEQSRVPGLEIWRGGVLIGAAQWGTPMPVDPGEIEILATANGKKDFKQTLRLEEGKTASFDLPALVDAGAATPEPAPGPPAQAKPAPSETDEESEDEDEAVSEPKSKKRRVESNGSGALLYTLAAAGVVGVGVGTGFALMARSSNEESKAHCDPGDPNSCDATGVKMRNDALAEGNIATAGFVVGGAALAGAGLMLLLGGGPSDKPKDKQGRLQTSAALGPRQGTVYLRGSF